MTEMYHKTLSLMERVVTRENLEAVAKAVRRNKGAAGIDNMAVFEIEKHKLGIPCVRDRVVQQAIRQVIEPIIDPYFMDNSHGFRPGKSIGDYQKRLIFTRRLQQKDSTNGV